MFIFVINVAVVLFAQLERIAFDFQRGLVRGWRCCYECWSFRQRSVRKRVGSTTRTRSIVSSQTAHLMITRTLYCVQGLSDDSFCVRRLQSQQEDSDRIEIQTKENFLRKGFGLINFFLATVSALIVHFCKCLFVTMNLVAFILLVIYYYGYLTISSCVSVRMSRY